MTPRLWACPNLGADSSSVGFCVHYKLNEKASRTERSEDSAILCWSLVNKIPIFGFTRDPHFLVINSTHEKPTLTKTLKRKEVVIKKKPVLLGHGYVQNEVKGEKRILHLDITCIRYLMEKI